MQEQLERKLSVKKTKWRGYISGVVLLRIVDLRDLGEEMRKRRREREFCVTGSA